MEQVPGHLSTLLKAKTHYGHDIHFTADAVEALERSHYSNRETIVRFKSGRYAVITAPLEVVSGFVYP